MKVSNRFLFNNVYACVVAATIEQYGYAEYTYRTTVVEINYLDTIREFQEQLSGTTVLYVYSY